MPAALASIAPRVGQLIRLLASDRDGEVVAGCSSSQTYADECRTGFPRPCQFPRAVKPARCQRSL